MIKIRNTIFTITLLLGFSSFVCGAKDQPDFYQVKIYHLKDIQQVEKVDTYLKDVYLPALHQLGIKNIGVFKPIANDTSAVKFIYVLIPFHSPEGWMKLEQSLKKNATYTAAAAGFIQAPSDSPPYERIESILLEAFPGQVHLLIPPTKSGDRVFELRSYESPTENLAEKKMAMFNTGGEIDIFKRLGFNPVFYAKVLSGARMPNFMYMPVFENLQEKDAQWKVFGNDPQWKEISSKPENENKVSVSHIDSIVMHSTPYSDY